MTIGIKTRILLSNIHQDLQGRLAQRLPTLRLHLSWQTAKDLGDSIKNRSLYGIPIIIHRDNDPKFAMDWEFR